MRILLAVTALSAFGFAVYSAVAMSAPFQMLGILFGGLMTAFCSWYSYHWNDNDYARG